MKQILALFSVLFIFGCTGVDWDDTSDNTTDNSSKPVNEADSFSYYFVDGLNTVNQPYFKVRYLRYVKPSTWHIHPNSDRMYTFSNYEDLSSDNKTMTQYKNFYIRGIIADSIYDGTTVLDIAAQCYGFTDTEAYKKIMNPNNTTQIADILSKAENAVPAENTKSQYKILNIGYNIPPSFINYINDSDSYWSKETHYRGRGETVRDFLDYSKLNDLELEGWRNTLFLVNTNGQDVTFYNKECTLIEGYADKCKLYTGKIVYASNMSTGEGVKIEGILDNKTDQLIYMDKRTNVSGIVVTALPGKDRKDNYHLLSDEILAEIKKVW